jgi:hypothetical protein
MNGGNMEALLTKAKELMEKLEKVGLFTDADNISRHAILFYKRGDRTMLERTVETAKLTLRQHAELQRAESDALDPFHE